MGEKTTSQRLRRLGNARRIFAWTFGVSACILIFVVLITPFPPPKMEEGPEPTRPPIYLDANFLAAVSTLVTSIGSLVGVILTHLRSGKELELEKAKLELEKLKIEKRLEKGDDGL